MHSGRLENETGVPGPGVRPSPAAETWTPAAPSKHPNAPDTTGVSAPGDGRTPSQPSAGSVVERAHAAAETAAQSSEIQLEELLEQLQSLPDPVARELAIDSVQSILDLYGRGLARVLQLTQNEGEKAKPVLDALLKDHLVSSLLLVHGLHPLSLQNRVHQALEKVRPYLRSHGGNVELVSLDDDVARLRFNGACKSCPSSAVTMELAIKRAIEDACPDLAAIELEGNADGLPPTPAAPPPPTSPTPNGNSWLELPGAHQFSPGEMRRLELQGLPLLVCRLNDDLYAYKDFCPLCRMPLSAFSSADGVLQCNRGHRFEVRHAGRSPNHADSHLDPLPLLVEGNSIKISLPAHL